MLAPAGFFLLGIKNKLSGVFLRKQLLFCFFTLCKKLIYRDLYCICLKWYYKNKFSEGTSRMGIFLLVLIWKSA